jgi:hypothetical protein
VFHIAKRSLSCKLYKPLTLLLFKMRLLRVSKAHEVLHGIRAGSFDNDGLFPPVVEHVFGQRYNT